MCQPLVRNTIVIQSLGDRAVYRVMFSDGERMESRVFINLAVKLLVENGQARGSGASRSSNPATGAPTTIPTPVREAAIAPEDRAAATEPSPTAE